MNEILDINGLYIWDNTIFDNMVIPSGLNKPELIDNIILDCRELSISISSPTIMKRAIELWSKKNKYYFDELYKTMQYQYNPIENYDRRSEIVTDTKTDNKNTTLSSRSSHGGDLMTHTGSDTVTDQLDVSAFNDSTLQPREKHTVTTTPQSTDNHAINSADTVNAESTDDGKTKTTMKEYTHGNIGIRSSQELITQQRDIINISMQQIIVDSFKKEFCVCKY